MQTALTKEKLVEFVKAEVSRAVAEIMEESLAKAKEQAKPPAILWGGQLQDAQVVQEQKGLAFARYIRLAASTKCHAPTMLELSKRHSDSIGKRITAGLEKSLSAGSLTAGGVFVPTEMSREVVQLLRNRTAVRALGARAMPMPVGTLQLSKITGGATAEYLGEGVAQRASQQTTGLLKLTYKKLRVTVPISNDLLRFEVEGADELVRDDSVSAMRVKEDASFIRGNGSEAAPKGLLFWATAGNKFNANATINPQNVAKDLGKAIQLLEEDNIPFERVGWIFSPRTKNFLMTQLDTNNNFLWRTELSAGRLFGFPFISTQQIPNNLGGGSNESEIYLTDFADAIIGESNDIEVQISSEASYVDSSGSLVSSFSNDETVIQLIARHDFGMRRDESIAIVQAVLWTT